MKKSKLINQPISAVIAGLGHLDEIVIADAGLPVPSTTKRIDLALARNIPRFSDALRAVLSELNVETAVVAAEMLTASPQTYEAVKAALGDVPIATIDHEFLKERTRTAKAVIRTGEFTPYANVILVAGVVF